LNVTGTAQAPAAQGRFEIKNGSIAYIDLPNALSEINGALVFNQDRIQIETLTAQTGGGAVQFQGYATARNHQIGFDVNVHGDDVRLRYPPGISSTANMDLRFAGTNTASMLSGDVTITRLAMSQNFDFSRGYFELAAAQQPKPTTVAMISADAEFARTAADGAKENAKALGFSIVYDRSYPPNTVDFSPVMRAVQAANADLVFVAAYPPDSVGIVRAAREIGLTAKMFGGAMIGLLATPLKTQLGPAMNNIVIMESFVPGFDFPGLQDFLAKYRTRAAGQQIDPFGYGFAPFGYAAGQILAQAVNATKSLDHDQIAKFIHTASFNTIAGDIAFGADGEWVKPRMVFSQFQGVQPGNADQFLDGAKQPVLWPAEYKKGTMIYPYAEAKR